MNTPCQWYYATADNQQAGPVPEPELRALLRQGAITRSTYVWREGMETWISYDQAVPPDPAAPDLAVGILAARLARAERGAQANRLAARRHRWRTRFVGVAGWCAVGAFVVFAAHLIPARARSEKEVRVATEFGTIEAPADWLAGKNPRHMSIEEKMAAADRYLAALGRAIPTFAAALRANRADPYCDISPLSDQFNRLTASNPFNALAFPCTRARGSSASPTAFARWFEDYRRREAALIAQLDGAGR